MAGDGRAGAVAAVTGILHPVRAARALLDDDETLLWAGHSSELVARYGLEAADPAQMVTAAARRHLDGGRQPRTGTVGAVCLDADGQLAAATSTGGCMSRAWSIAGQPARSAIRISRVASGATGARSTRSDGRRSPANVAA
jgi:isoaspartyl peptidase/L-asparaginase-like protein (Ntn-hydrolase superfamily)